MTFAHLLAKVLKSDNNPVLDRWENTLTVSVKKSDSDKYK